MELPLIILDEMIDGIHKFVNVFSLFVMIVDFKSLHSWWGPKDCVFRPNVII